ncbi:MAG: alanine--tRNA ligase-related protein [Bacteroidota bacterium]
MKKRFLFLRTLDKGLKKIETLNEISGEQAFELYDTYGFPFDLTSLIARERGFTVDEKGFTEEMKKQKSRSKIDAAKETGDWITVGDDVKNGIHWV